MVLQKSILVIFTLIYVNFPNSLSDFKTIPGPKSKSDRIAIIGAGPAGVHMAYKLKKEGFDNIVIFEKTERIGGKSLAYMHRGSAHEMGSIYLTVEYESIFELIEEFNTSTQVVYPDRAFWLNNETPLTLPEYLMAAAGIQDIGTLSTRFTEEFTRYASLHFSLFGTYNGELMPRPRYNVLYKIRGTFQDFLDRNNFEIIPLIFISSHTAQGYGYLDNVAALYGLMWMTPRFLEAILNGTNSPFQWALIEPFQTIWEEIVRQMQIEVKFGVDIQQIRRRFRNDISIDYEYSFTGCRRREKFDFLILTPNMPSLRNIVDFQYKEWSLFSKITDKGYFITTLFDSGSGIRSTSPLNHYSFNQRSLSDYDVWASVDTYAANRGYVGDEYRQGNTSGSDDCTHCQTITLYQYGRDDPNRPLTRRRVNQLLRKHLIFYEQSDAVQVYQKIWPYFYRFPPREIQRGRLWDVFDIQGTQNTWYIGASVSFESIKSVVEYNNLLIRQANLQSY